MPLQWQCIYKAFTSAHWGKPGQNYKFSKQMYITKQTSRELFFELKFFVDSAMTQPTDIQFFRKDSIGFGYQGSFYRSKTIKDKPLCCPNLLFNILTKVVRCASVNTKAFFFMIIWYINKCPILQMTYQTVCKQKVNKTKLCYYREKER